MSEGEAGAGQSRSTPMRPGPRAPLGPGPFVGRGRELASLRAQSEAALGGRPGRVWVLGDAGIGKTRTVEELACYCRLRGAPVHNMSPQQIVADPARISVQLRSAAPGLVVLDGADCFGVAEVGQAVRALESGPMLVAITVRARELESEFSGDLRITLSALSVDEVARLLSMFSRQKVSSELARRVVNQTDGNPARVRSWIRRHADMIPHNQSNAVGR